ncbi:hypothetical protein P7B02_03630 [Caulobacter segnis]|uniref:hypothetical protein n=1 Tax=Caulobacter segnis TaxID=88688 RepID=UPI0024105F2C|nr:hypothetical protein [Caulobacter segnis]MDG2520622.1 hypothetical protein [Caulobacter segnis]
MPPLLHLALAITASTPLVVGSGLQCSAGHASVMKALAQTPGIVAQPVAAAAPFGVYADAATRSLYTFTTDKHAAHPAVFKRRVVNLDGRAAIEVSACGYGDAASFWRLVQEMNALSSGALKAGPSRSKRASF